LVPYLVSGVFLKTLGSGWIGRGDSGEFGSSRSDDRFCLMACGDTSQGVKRNLGDARKRKIYPYCFFAKTQKERKLKEHNN
jgi:hypothetical protein